MADTDRLKDSDPLVQQAVSEVRNFPGAFYVHDSKNDRIVFLSERMWEYIGYTTEEIQSMKFGGRSLIHPEDLPEVLEMNASHKDLADGEFAEATYRILHKNGDWTWLRSEEYVFKRNKQKDPVATIGMVHDVTPIKERELELERMADYNSFLVETSRLVTEGSVDIKSTLQELAHMISDQFNVVCNIFFLEEKDMSIQPGATYYYDKEVVTILDNLFAKYTVKLGEGMVGKAIQDGTEFIMHEVDDDIRKRTVAVDPRLEPVGMAYLPLKGHTKIVGAINLTRLVEFIPLTKQEWENIAQVVRNVSLFVEHSLITNTRKLELERLEKAEAEIRSASEGTAFQYEISQLVSDLEKDRSLILKDLAKRVSYQFDAVCDLHLVVGDQLEPLAMHYRQKTVRKKVDKLFEKGRFKIGQGRLGKVAETGEEFVVQILPEEAKIALNNAGTDPEIIPVSYLYMPLFGINEVVGVLGLSRLSGFKPFNRLELDRIRNVANTISEFLAKRQLHDKQIEELEKRTQAEADLQELNRNNQFLLGISSQLSDLSSDMNSVLQGLTDQVRQHFSVACSVHVVDPLHAKLKPLAVSHPDPAIGEKIRKFFQRHYFDIDYSMIGKVVGGAEEFFLAEVTEEDRKWFDSDDPDLIPSALLFLPINGRSNVLGILDITKTTKGEPITTSETVYLREVAQIVALFIENHHLFSKHRRELNKRRKVEELLREQNERVMENEKELRNILDTMPILVSRINRDFRYQFANKSYKKSLDLDPEWMEGKHISEIMGEEMFERVMPNLERVLGGEVMMYQSQGKTKNGKQMHFDVVHSPDFDQDGNVRGILSCIVDISDRAKAEQELEVSEERLRIIFDNVEDVISTFNEEGQLESVNRTAQGLSLEDVIGSRILDYFQDPEKRKIVQSGLDELINTGTPFSVESQFVSDEDGTVRWYASRFAAVRENGRFVKGIIITRDITGQKHEEKAIMTGMLQGQEVERKRLAAEMHDGVGQILAAISIELSQLSYKKTEIDGNDIRQVSEKVQSAITEVRVISHALKPDVLENFGLVPAIQEVVDSASTDGGPDLSFNHIDVQRRFDESVEINMYRSLQELITNCLKHANANDIFITLILDEEKLILTVEDDGDGFKEKDPTGIGINNVRSRIALIGGTVTIDSSEGKGSLINIEVPIEDGKD